MKFCPKCASELEKREIDGRDRRVCTDTSCNFVHWNNPTPVVAAIIEHEGEMILARNKGWPPKWFGLVTGFLEAREHPDEAVLREVKEELGLDGEVVDFVGHYTFEQMNQIILAYHVVAEGEIVLGDELEAFKRVPPEKLRPWPQGTGKAVADWIQRRKS